MQLKSAPFKEFQFLRSVLTPWLQVENRNPAAAEWHHLMQLLELLKWSAISFDLQIKFLPNLLGQRPWGVWESTLGLSYPRWG